MSNKKENLIITCFIILSIVIIGFVLFKAPYPGVADQDDFYRVMASSGLGLTDAVKNNPNFNRFFQYIVTDYQILDQSFSQIIYSITNTTMAIPIYLISFICGIFGTSIFKTSYLAIFYAVFYLLSMVLILKYLNIKNNLKLILLSALTLFVFFDGNYLVWFNSLYGEPMMLVSLLLFLASTLYYLHYKNTVKSDKNVTLRIFFIISSSFLLLGSKLQLMTAIPVVLFIVIKALYENRKVLNKFAIAIFALMLIGVIIYPINASKNNVGISKDNNYNSVFYGVLKDSPDPIQDLIDMGLDPDLASEAGKHAYEPTEKYKKYVPRTPLTEEVFYKNMSRGKLVKFYLTHPKRFFEGMEYTTDSAYYTSTALGKYSQSEVSEPTSEFKRFTTWSYIRENFMPRSLFFISIIFIIAIAVSAFIFLINKNVKEIKDKIYLYWCLLFLAVLQFPMPFVGNGHADTSKQLYLFNFIFDIILVSLVYVIFSVFINKFSRRKINA